MAPPGVGGTPAEVVVGSWRGTLRQDSGGNESSWMAPTTEASSRCCRGTGARTRRSVVAYPGTSWHRTRRAISADATPLGWPRCLPWRDKTRPIADPDARLCGKAG